MNKSAATSHVIGADLLETHALWRRPAMLQDVTAPTLTGALSRPSGAPMTLMDAGTWKALTLISLTLSCSRLIVAELLRRRNTLVNSSQHSLRKAGAG